MWTFTFGLMMDQQIVTELVQDGHRIGGFNWLKIGIGLCEFIRDWYSIGRRFEDWSCIGDRLVRDWQIGPGLTLGWQIVGDWQWECKNIAAWIFLIVLRRDTSSGLHSTLVPRYSTGCPPIDLRLA